MWAENFKAVTAASTSLILGSAQDNRMSAKRLDQIGEAVVATAAITAVSPDPVEAISTQKILSGSDAQQQTITATLMTMATGIAAIMAKLAGS